MENNKEAVKIQSELCSTPNYKRCERFLEQLKCEMTKPQQTAHTTTETLQHCPSEKEELCTTSPCHLEPEHPVFGELDLLFPPEKKCHTSSESKSPYFLIRISDNNHKDHYQQCVTDIATCNPSMLKKKNMPCKKDKEQRGGEWEHWQDDDEDDDRNNYHYGYFPPGTLFGITREKIPKFKSLILSKESPHVLALFKIKNFPCEWNTNFLAFVESVKYIIVSYLRVLYDTSRYPTLGSFCDYDSWDPFVERNTILNDGLRRGVSFAKTTCLTTKKNKFFICVRSGPGCIFDEALKKPCREDQAPDSFILKEYLSLNMRARKVALANAVRLASGIANICNISIETEFETTKILPIVSSSSSSSSSGKCNTSAFSPSIVGVPSFVQFCSSVDANVVSKDWISSYNGAINVDETASRNGGRIAICVPKEKKLLLVPVSTYGDYISTAPECISSSMHLESMKKEIGAVYASPEEISHFQKLKKFNELGAKIGKSISTIDTNKKPIYLKTYDLYTINQNNTLDNIQ